MTREVELMHILKVVKFTSRTQDRFAEKADALARKTLTQPLI